ncbi:MAG: hypothetical protein K2Y37_01155 [Pirellulales bacterium]|nr:hypothetical protein [Pirellulales bacterium]
MTVQPGKALFSGQESVLDKRNKPCWLGWQCQPSQQGHGDMLTTVKGHFCCDEIPKRDRVGSTRLKLFSA